MTDAGGVTRRRLLAGGGAGVGLVVAWGLWPRSWPDALAEAPGEHAVAGWLKLAEDGAVTLACPQCEGGQGSWSALARVAAEELGADWRQMGVEAAPVGGRYANPLGLDELLEGMFARAPRFLRARAAEASPLLLTAGSTSVRAFEERVREAAAAARAMLVSVAADRWGADAADCRTERGFVVAGDRRLRFGELAADAAALDPPRPAPVRGPVRGAGTRRLPRLDAAPKVDGAAVFAGDVRLADMVHARVRAGPVGAGGEGGRLIAHDRAAAERVAGMRQVVATDRWVAAIATTGWAAERGLDALSPRFATTDPADDAAIDRALRAALLAPGTSMGGQGDPDLLLKGPGVVSAEYRAATGLHAGLETASAAASWRDGRLELWAPTEAPARCRAAAAAAAGVSEDRVTLHPTLAGGAFGARLEPDAAAQAALLAMKLGRPVSLAWTRGEEVAQGRHRSPALARLSGRTSPAGRVPAWRADLASAATGAGLADRLAPAGLWPFASDGDPYSVGGLAPPYSFGAWATAHHLADLPLRTGHLRGGAHGVNCFFTESFLDELAAAGGHEPLGFRIAMLGAEPRLARCLSTAAALGGWDGGSRGSGQGLACHRFRGSYVAVLAEVGIGPGGGPRVDRLVAAVDCGRAVDVDLVRQQVEGGLVFGLGLALGASTGWAGGRPSARGFDRVRLPRMADCPDITVELIDSGEAPGGVSELAVPPVAPAIANALHTLTDRRWRTLPLA